MNVSTDPSKFQSQLAARKISGSGSGLTLAGLALVAVGLGLGVWWGIKSADNQAVQAQPTTRQDVPLSASATSATTLAAAATTAGSKVTVQPSSSLSGRGGIGVSNSVSNAASMSQGEVIVAQPRFARPPPVFDAVEALAAQASLVAATATAVQRPSSAGSPSPAGQRTASAPVPAAVVPTGWQGTGSALLQMWDLGAQSEWAVRPAPLSPRNWRISGVVQRGEQTQAIVQFDGDPAPKFFKIGDTLPGGAKLAWVKPNVIGVVMPKTGVLAVPVLDGQEPPPPQRKKP